MNRIELKQTSDGLGLIDSMDSKTKPLVLDFLTYVKPNMRGKNDLIARAMALRQYRSPMIFDLTCGLAQDAIFLASLGARVKAFERNPFVYSILMDAYSRATQNSSCPKWLIDNFQVVNEDAKIALSQPCSAGQPEIIYMDPMYPEKKSGSSRKEMNFLRLLVGDDNDSAEICQLALQVASKRVVVKRPLKAPPLIEGVSHVFRGTTVRFDMYLT